MAPVYTERSFMERHRNRIIGAGILGAVIIFGAFIFISASQPTYACSIQLDPASPPPSGVPVTGQHEDDMGRGHVTPGTTVTYTYCPPASGKHYNSTGLGPIAPRFYGPDDTTVPDGWIHNLEHGGIVILYNCARSGCDTNSLDQLKALVSTFPASPICKLPRGLISPVIARFDDMKANFAAVVWGRVLLQDKLDTAQMLEFFQNEGERNNPEQQCNPSASPGASPSGPTPNPAAADSAVPGVQPAPTDSGSSGTPAASGSPAESGSPAASGSPAPSGT